MKDFIQHSCTGSGGLQILMRRVKNILLCNLQVRYVSGRESKVQHWDVCKCKNIYFSNTSITIFKPCGLFAYASSHNYLLSLKKIKIKKYIHLNTIYIMARDVESKKKKKRKKESKKKNKKLTQTRGVIF